MAIDWRRGMQRTYELVRVDDDWRERELVQHLTDGSITWEPDGLRYSAKFKTYERLTDGYYRVYMVCSQGRESARVALATVRVQTPKRSTDGKAWQYEAAGYSPLVELDSAYPPLGWTAQGNVVEQARAIVAANCHAPVSAAPAAATMDAWTADDGDTWLDCLEAVLAKAQMHVEVDGTGCVSFAADPDAAMLNPAWTFDDAAYGLPSILMPDVDESTDYYDLVNRVEVIYSDADGTLSAVREDADAIEARGYVNAKRETSPEIDAPVTQAKIDAYADKMMAEQATATHSASFSHAFVPQAKVGACVRLDYTRMGYRVDALVVGQSLKLTTRGVVDTDIEYKEALYDGD